MFIQTTDELGKTPKWVRKYAVPLIGGVVSIAFPPAIPFVALAVTGDQVAQAEAAERQAKKEQKKQTRAIAAQEQAAQQRAAQAQAAQQPNLLLPLAAIAAVLLLGT